VTRREFIRLLGGAAAVWPLAARAQQPGRIRRVGVLMLYVENDPEGQARATAFRQGLEKRGWTVGRDLQIDYHWGVGDGDWIRSAAAGLLTEAPDVILANGGAAARAVQQSTRAVPVVFIGGADPMADGLVQGLARPGGNLTGFTTLETSVGAKLLELLKDIAPRLTRIAVLINPDNPGSPRLFGISGIRGAKVCRGRGRTPGSQFRGDRSCDGEVGTRAGRRLDRATGSLHKLLPPAHRRVGVALPHTRNSHIARRRR